MGKTNNWAFCGNLGSKRLRPPRKIPQNAPLYVLPQTKKIISRTVKFRGTLVHIFMSQKERGESERARAKVRARARARAGKGKGKRERELKCR